MLPSTVISLTVNGRPHEARVAPRTSTADFLREQLNLTGTHIGCEHGVCGACTILLDGAPVRSCLLFAIQLDGAKITTIEGLKSEDGKLHRLQEAFRTHHALHCGFCTPGMILALAAFLEKNPNPSEPQVREAIAGNLCMCTGYQNIVKAALAAATCNGVENRDG